MEFDEVNHFVKHGKSTSTPLDDHNIAGLGIGTTPYYPDFPYPQTFTSINNKKRPITAKFVDTVRHRLRKSSSISTSAVNSDTEEYNNSQQRRPLKRVQTSPLKNNATLEPILIKSKTTEPATGITDEYPHYQRKIGGGRRLFRLRKNNNSNKERREVEKVEGYYTSVDDPLYHRKKRRPTLTKNTTSIHPTTTTTSTTTKTGLWKRRRRKRRPSSAIQISSPIVPPTITNTIPITTTAGGIIPLQTALSSRKLAALQVISDQMRSFHVPSDWASISRSHLLSSGSSPPPILEALDRQRGSPITLDNVIDDVTEGIYRYQYLCDQEQKRIESSRQEIEEYIKKLQQLDCNVEQLNSKIVLARSEGMKRMQNMLQETQHRLPLVKQAWLKHKKTVVAIEGYNKSMNYADRIVDLQNKVIAARQRQITWNCVQRWIPSIVIVVISALVGLLISFTTTTL
ncbi:hypothetical protein BDC45DRAFT_535423 [Circinella umbellata]|nr:hypothetical protein BDC45DRAFT_535423 [Circinella umbellata]